MKRTAIDMDEVIADALGSLLAMYNAEFGVGLTVEALYGGEIKDAIEVGRHGRIDAYLLAEGFFRNLAVMPDSQGVIEELAQKYEVFITTAAMEFPSSFTPKYEWLREHFPFLHDSRFVFCGDKSIVQADYLIDDRQRHFERFAGEGILFTAPHNVHETRYRRVNSWREVAEMFL